MPRGIIPISLGRGRHILRNLDFCMTLVFILVNTTPSVHAKMLTGPTYQDSCQLKETATGLSADCAAKGLTKLPEGLPKELASLSLNVNNISILTNQSFNGFSALKNLSLTKNVLTCIEKDAFFPLLSLRALILDHNKLTSLHSELFVQNHHLRIIQLSYNMLTSVPTGAFEPLKDMQKIILDGNSIHSMNFTGYSPINISYLSVGRNEVSKIIAEDFQALSSSQIGRFYLFDNNIMSLPDYAFMHLRYLTKLVLSNNRLSCFNFSSLIGMESLQVLFLASCRIKYIMGFPNNSVFRKEVIPPLKNMTLSNNKISFLPSRPFIGLKLLTYLDLSVSKIKLLSNDSFQGLVSLTTLNLANNLLESVNGEIFSHIPRLTILNLSRNKFTILSPKQLQGTGLDQLTVLNMSYNIIQRIKDESWDLPSLKSLDLSSNLVDSLKTNLFSGLNNLYDLTLASNPIRTLVGRDLSGLDNLINLDLSHLSLLQDLQFPFEYAGRLMKLKLSYSNLGSIINLFPGLTSLQELKLEHASFRNIVRDDKSAFCSVPNLKVLALSGNSFFRLYPEIFCELRNLTHLTLDNCKIKSLPQNIFRNLISLKILLLDRNNIVSLSPQHFADLNSLSILRLQKNQLQGVLDKDLLRNNTQLYIVALANNALTGIANNMFLPMEILDISGNPLSCTCALQWFRHYLKTSHLSLGNPDKTNCSSTSVPQFVGKHLIDFDPDIVCGPNIAISVCTTVLGILLLIGGALAYRNRWWLNYKCFHVKLLLLGYYEIEDAREHLDYNYDVNIIYADDDEEWVRNAYLKAFMEHFPDFARERVVCGEDDLPLGGPRMDAIDYVIEGSFKTLAIISNASINDAHFMTMLQMAVEHMNEIRLEKVVVVFREDIPDKQLPYLVRLFLSKNKPYFRWTEDRYGQRWFWEKLAKFMRGNKQMNSLLPI